MPWNRLKSRTKHHVIGVVGAAVLAVTSWFLSRTFPPGMLSYLVTLPACVMVLLTSLARVNDIGPERSSWMWQVRRIGLALAGAMSAAFAAAPFTDQPSYPSWLGAGVFWALAISWFTSPNLPPWWKYISGEEDAPIDETLPSGN